MNNLVQRTITGALFVAAILASIYFQPSYHVLSILFFFVTCIALDEFYKMVNQFEGVKVPTWGWIAAGLLLYGAVAEYARFEQFFVLPVFALVLIALILWELFRNEKLPMQNIAFGIMGLVLVALPFGYLNMIAVPSQIHFVFALFILIWVSDTGAYLVGSQIGKHKMFVRVSPKKSWEGLIGGVVFCLATSILFWYLYSSVWPVETPVSWWKWLLFGVIIAIFGTLGDLTESLLKRSAGVKDSGNILPGHGGLLDRFDSLILCIPVIYIYLTFVI